MLRRPFPFLLVILVVLLLAGRWDLAAQQRPAASGQGVTTESQASEERGEENPPQEGEPEPAATEQEQSEEAPPAEAAVAQGETETSEESTESPTPTPEGPQSEEATQGVAAEGNEASAEAPTAVEGGETVGEEPAAEATPEEQVGNEGGEGTQEPGTEGEVPEAGTEGEPETETQAEAEPQVEPEAPPESTTAEGAETAPEEELSPEEQERLEEIKRKREAILAKRAAKKAREDEKKEQKRLAEEAKEAERLDTVLAKAYEALYAGKLGAARQAFEKHMQLGGGDSYGGRMGLARIELARDNQAAAIEQALKAVKATTEGAERAEAWTFAAETTLAARPRDEASGAPLPGTELFRDNALRYYMQALVADPEGASEARAALEEAFPTHDDERTERFTGRYLESSETAPLQNAKRLAATYEALLSGRIDGPLSVAGGITAPEKISGSRPPYPQNPASVNIRRRLVIGLIVEPDGTVSKARVLNGIDAKLDRAAETFMLQWTFEPARLPSGAPVEVYYVVVTNADTEPLEPLVAEEESEETSEGTSAERTGREATGERAAAESETSARESARRERSPAAADAEASAEAAPEPAEAAETPPEDSPAEAGEAPPDQPEREDDQ